MQTVAVADPSESRRNLLKQRHNISDDNVFTDWAELAAKPRVADAVIVSTQDSIHLEPALAFAKAGYHLLLEKPIAPESSIP